MQFFIDNINALFGTSMKLSSVSLSDTLNILFPHLDKLINVISQPAFEFLNNITIYNPENPLPLGISFYTFQTLTYVIDVYRGSPAQQKFRKYILYLTMYFQLVAGPIVRYSDVAKEIEHRNTNLYRISHGIYRFMVGLGKKVIIANSAGVFVDKYMSSDPAALTTFGAWFGIIMYTIQLYYDFSGYSDMAIGLGHIFGFKFPENFNYPYISKSVSEFWRRWHMTLGSFFRDYVYIPLGGNRRRVYFNLVVVWFLTGFWHGASWNFVVWGLYNGFFIILERLTKTYFERIPAVIRHIYLLVVVNIGFVFFYFTNMSNALGYIKAMFSLSNGFITKPQSIEFVNNIFWIIAAIMFCMPVMKFIEKLYHRATSPSTTLSGNILSVSADVIRLAVIFTLLFVSTCHLVGISHNPFLYFNF